jgi:hypothetical protein
MHQEKPTLVPATTPAKIPRINGTIPSQPGGIPNHSRIAHSMSQKICLYIFYLEKSA